MTGSGIHAWMTGSEFYACFTPPYRLSLSL